MPILILFLMTCLGVAGDFFLKLAGQKATVNYPYFVIGLIIYASTAFGWLYVMRHIKLGPLGAMYSVFLIIMLAALGTFYFKEQLGAREVIGITFGLASLILLAKFA